MKRLILCLLFLATPVLAQDFHETILRPVTGHNIPYTTTSTTTQLDITCCDSSGVRIIRVIADTDAFMAIAASDYTTSAFSADTATGILLPSMAREYFKVSPGAQIAVRASDLSGNLYIYEMSP